MKKIQLTLMLSLLVLAGSGCGRQEYAWIWSKNIEMPTSLLKDKQQLIADCAVAKVYTAELKSTLINKFPMINKEWIEGITIRTVDATEVMDYYGKGIEIWIEMPSTKEAYSSESPVVDYVASQINQQLKSCSDAA